MIGKTRTWIAGIVFAVGSVAGIALATAGLMPSVGIELAVPAREAREYRPGSVAATGAEDEIVLVYLGSSSCGWSNLPEVSRAVRDAKILVAGHARDAGMRFSALGVALDADALRGWAHLRKAGLFDEVAAGMGWANSGADKYVFGALAGPASTPQLLVVQRSLGTGPGGRPKAESERVLVRKTGSNAILSWVARGAAYEGRPNEVRAAGGV
ncbi:MAG: hypothetical protein F4X13_08495 [Gammaproteobacteria bacterium]|nr:hypothetical protein [Gammaproteobacteria bacterium]